MQSCTEVASLNRRCRARGQLEVSKRRVVREEEDVHQQRSRSLDSGISALHLDILRCWWHRSLLALNSSSLLLSLSLFGNGILLFDSWSGSLLDSWLGWSLLLLWRASCGGVGLLGWGTILRRYLLALLCRSLLGSLGLLDSAALDLATLGAWLFVVALFLGSLLGWSLLGGGWGRS